MAEGTRDVAAFEPRVLSPSGGRRPRDARSARANTGSQLRASRSGGRSRTRPRGEPSGAVRLHERAWPTDDFLADGEGGGERATRLARPQRPARSLDRIAIDTRERYGYTFKGREVELERKALRAGDYAAFRDGIVVAVVERKAMDDFCNSLIDGTLGFAMGELAQLGTTAVVVEGTYTQLLRRGFVDGAWLGDILVRLQVRYPGVPIVFTETRALGERWTFAFFAAAAAEQTIGAPIVAAVIDDPKPAPKRRVRRAPKAEVSDEH